MVLKNPFSDMGVGKKLQITKYCSRPLKISRFNDESLNLMAIRCLFIQSQINNELHGPVARKVDSCSG